MIPASWQRHPAFTWGRWLPDQVVIGLARCGPVGTVRKGPGTAGSVLGIAIYAIFFFHFSLIGQILGILFASYLAVVICGEAELRLRKRDPGEVVLDEVVAIPLCFLGLRPLMEDAGMVWVWILVGFVLFRLFDIFKPLGIHRLQSLPFGWGVVADDLAAALATWVLLLAMLIWIGA
ncbi:MAG: phosphatidylglycerophosphatase A [Opitutales bacterium]|nr:phosphatidylglycerophosphatase A [Opitutales bacterium]